jgi:hypothetical protein
MSRTPNTRSSSAASKPQPHRPAPPRPDGKQLPPTRPKSLLSRFRRVSQYDPSFSSSSSSFGVVEGGGGRGSLITIPTLERMRELDRCEVDVDWEKVKTLPRVCLIPPEGMSQARDSERLHPLPVLDLLTHQI